MSPALLEQAWLWGVGWGRSRHRSSSWLTSKEGSPWGKVGGRELEASGPQKGTESLPRGRRGGPQWWEAGEGDVLGPPDEDPSFPLFLCSHSSGPKADSSPKGSRGLGGLKSEFLKQSAARGVRTQDQPAGSKGKSSG